MMLVGVLVVFAAGGVFGFGVYHYLDSKKKPAVGSGADARAQTTPPVRTDDTPTPPRKEEPAPKKEESKPPPKPAKEETPAKPVPPPVKEDFTPPLSPVKKEPPPKPVPPPKPEPKPEPAPKPEPPPKPEPAPKPEPPPKPGEDPGLPRELRPLVARLKTGTAEEQVKAAGELAALGGKAKPAAAALCEAAVSESKKVSRAALEALEKVHPDLQNPIFLLLVDEKAVNHQAALTKLVGLGKQAKPAVPVVLHEITRCQKLLADPRAAWGQNVLVQVTIHSLRALPKIAPDDPQALKMVTDMTKFTAPEVIVFNRPLKTSPDDTVPGGRPKGFGGVFTQTKTPFREDGLELLGELAKGQPKLRKEIIPPVVALLKEAVERTNGPNESEILAGITEVDQACNTLLQCGTEVKKVLTKEVIPQLKDLQFHKSESVRATAKKLRKKIEDAP